MLTLRMALAAITGVAERVVRTVCAECLDWFLILNREHLEHVLAAFVAHYNTLRPDPALDLTPPQRARPLFALTKDSGELHVQRRDRLGGEIHEYGRAA